MTLRTDMTARSTRHRPALAGFVAGFVALLALPALTSAQSITSASVSGTVRSNDFRPVGQAFVTLNPVGSGSTYDATTGAGGTFTIPLVQAGSYEIRVEALGYRPLVARILSVSGGDDRSVTLTLTPDPPPVERVDTVALSADASTRWRGGGVQFGGDEIEALPYRFDDLAAIASLSTVFDESAGAQGLPGDMTLIVADGLPFWRAPHPTARQELLPDALFPRAAVSGVEALHNATDVELWGSAGGYLSVATRTSTETGSFEVDGAWSGTPLWSSSRLDLDAPSLLTAQGAARGTAELSPNARVLVAAEALRQETPMAPRFGEPLSGELSGLDADLLADLTDPGVETYDRFSGLVRFDLQQGRNGHIFFRGSGSYARRAFDGAGPISIAGPGNLPEESSDLSTAFGIVNRYSRNTLLEFRAGFSGSFRDFDGAPLDRGAAWLVGPAVTLGGIPGAGAYSTRTDFVAIPAVRWTPSVGTTLKFGLNARASGHSMSHSRASTGDLVFATGSALLDGRGYGVRTSSGKAEFGTREFGAFAQYEAQVSPGLRFRFGGRFDLESVGGDDVPLNTALLATTGLDTRESDVVRNQFGVRASATWEPSGDGRTRVFLAASLHDGNHDLRALSALYGDATEGSTATYTGTGIDWPVGGTPTFAAPALPSLTLLGPDARAPRTTNLDLGVLRRIGTLGAVFVRGSTRRTDYLMRRRDLNLPLVTTATGPDGRGIYGTLQQDGPMVTATGADVRRFTDFGPVWALDPDGWSEYVGVTAGFEHVGTHVDVYGSYTWSETTDNWVGARSGSVGAALEPGLPPAASEEPWAEGVSDFDVPHRAALGATARFGAVGVSGIYRFRSGLPFTPGYRLGVDANGDGSIRNDVAFVPDVTELGELVDRWSCLEDQAGGFAVRNSCRRPSVHSLSVRLSLTLDGFVGRSASLLVDGLNLLESTDGLVDSALLLVDPGGSITTSPDGSTVTIPTTVNPDFGQILYPSTRGRMLRIGVRIGG